MKMTVEKAIRILEEEKEESCLLESYGDGDTEWAKAYNMAIYALKHKLKTWQWIPVSERLPEKNGRYLVTSPLGDRFIVRIGYFVNNERCFACENATAWLPLPQPYKEESEE